MKLTLQPNETIIRAGDSNLLVNGNKIKGKLIVTNQRIYFRTIRVDCKKNDREIMPGEISDLYFFNTRWILPKGMNIKTKDGSEIHFEVSHRSEWAKIITRMY
ncbi:MAG: hypothetical protein JXA61_06200 [Bacteroidales bacterium]|nr:hypothetical protein [Bacteroidales bacterium]